MHGRLPREQRAAASLLWRQVEIRAHGDFTAQAGEAAHFGQDVLGRRYFALRRRGIAADVIGLDDLRAEPAQRGHMVIIDRDDAGGVAVVVKKLRTVGHHGEGPAALARLAQDRRAQKIIAETERTEQQDAPRQPVPKKGTEEAGRCLQKSQRPPHRRARKLDKV
jgi:hypothetical protein